MTNFYVVKAPPASFTSIPDLPATDLDGSPSTLFLPYNMNRTRSTFHSLQLVSAQKIFTPSLSVPTLSVFTARISPTRLFDCSVHPPPSQLTMRSVSLATILSLASFFQISSSMPFEKRGPSPTYSIVNVDGSNGPNGAVTITQIQTQTVTLATVTETVLATITLNAAAVLETSLSSISMPTTSTSSTSNAEIPTEANGPGVATVTVTAAPTPTSYYDDGFWHTRYPIEDASPSLEAALSSSMSSASLLIYISIFVSPFIYYLSIISSPGLDETGL